MKVLCPNFEKYAGLVTVVAVEYMTSRVLMVASTDEAGFLETLATGYAVYYSRSRKERWKKGETTGHVQRVLDIHIDCDNDALVYVVDQKGSACHTGASTCFFDSCIHGRRRITLFPPNEIPTRKEIDVLVNHWLMDGSRIY